MNILLATDGSPHSQAAIELLKRMAFPPGSRLTLLGVMESPPAYVAELEQPVVYQEWKDEALRDTGQLLERTAADLRQAGWDAAALVREGHAAREIVAAAEEFGAELIVVGSHGQGGIQRFLLGSVSSRVAQHAPCSVLVVRPPREAAGDDERLKLLLAFDNSDASRRAAELLRSLPLGDRAEVRVLSVMTVVKAYRMDLVEHMSEFWLKEKQAAEAALESLAASLRQELPHVEARLVESENVARTILDEADDQQSDLIVVGSTGKNAIDRFLLGSVSNRVLHHAPCSTLIVR